MKKLIDLIIKREVAQAKENLIYELLGKYGNKIPTDVDKDMRKYADDFAKEVEQLEKRIKE